MFTKIFVVVCFSASSIALDQSYQHATSFASFNDNHNTIEHIHSRPALGESSLRYSAPAHSAPPSAYSGQAHSSVQYSPLKSAPQSSIQYSSLSSGKIGGLPGGLSGGLQGGLRGGLQGGPQEGLLGGLPGSHSIPVAQYSAPVPHAGAFSAGHQQEEYGPAEYEFSYGVEDKHTGDIHSHRESRHGDQTQGEYSLHEADGTIRIVKYTVDGHSGFNAVVDRSGQPHQQH